MIRLIKDLIILFFSARKIVGLKAEEFREQRYKRYKEFALKLNNDTSNQQTGKNEFFDKTKNLFDDLSRNFVTSLKTGFNDLNKYFK